MTVDRSQQKTKMKTYSTTELMEALGIGERKAKELMRSKSFPSFKVGRLWKVEEGDLMRWIKERKEQKRWQ